MNIQFDMLLGDVVHGLVGESEKSVANIFQIARRISPTVVFIDEFQGKTHHLPWTNSIMFSSYFRESIITGSQ